MLATLRVLKNVFSGTNREPLPLTKEGKVHPLNEFCSLHTGKKLCDSTTCHIAGRMFLRSFSDKVFTEYPLLDANGKMPIHYASEACEQVFAFVTESYSKSGIPLDPVFGGVTATGDTILHTAVYAGCVKNVTYILGRMQEWVNVNAMNNQGKTALAVAADMGRKDIVKLLSCGDTIDTINPPPMRSGKRKRHSD